MADPEGNAGGEGGNGDWRAGLPEDIRSNPGLADIKDVGALAKIFIDTKQMQGNSIQIPGADAKPEEWDKALFSKTGWPEKVEGYSRIDKTGKGENWGYNDDFENAWYNMVHKHRLSNKQANGLLQDLNANQLEAFNKDTTDSEAKFNEAKKGMETKFGQSLPEKLEQAKRFISQFAGEEFVNHLNDSGLRNDPRFLEFMINVSDNWAEDHAVSTQRGVTALGSSPDQINDAIRDLQKDERFTNTNHPQHKEVLEKLSGYFKMLTPATK